MLAFQGNPPDPGGFWGFARKLVEDHGAIVIVLGLVCFLFYKLIWKVWDATIRAKDEEIERLVKERDRYQEIVFADLQSSNIKPAADNAELSAPEGPKS